MLFASDPACLSCRQKVHTEGSPDLGKAELAIPARLANVKTHVEGAVFASPASEKMSSLAAVSPTDQGTPSAKFYAGVKQVTQPTYTQLHLAGLA